MKLWILTTLCTASLLTFSGCVSQSLTPKAEPVVDTTLPVVQLTKNGVFVDMNAIAFEWKSIKDPRVKGVYIYKNTLDADNTEDEYYKTIRSRFTTHFVDEEIKPNTQYSYFFKTYSDKAESIKSKTTIVNSLPILDSVVWIQSIQNMPRSAKIIWRPHTNEKVKAYIIERNTLEDSDWEKIATINGRLNAEYIDFDLKDKYVYKYRVRVVTYDNIISEPSKIVKVVTKALPYDIIDISATRNLPKRIDVRWKKSIVKDFAHYNVYRSSNVDGNFELVANVKDNYFIDKINEDGKQYFYRISAVDKDGLESEYEKQAIQGITLVKPEAPIFSELKLINNKVNIFWKKGDPRIKSYVVAKRYKKDWLDEVKEEFEGIKGTSFVDANIEPNITYYYKIYGVDEFFIKSEPSIEAEFKSDKLPARESMSQKQEIEVQKVPSSVKRYKKSDTSGNSEIVIPTQDFN